jgi:hypothetical protein
MSSVDFLDFSTTLDQLKSNFFDLKPTDVLRQMVKQDPAYKAAVLGLKPLKVAQASSIGLSEYKRH